MLNVMDDVMRRINQAADEAGEPMRGRRADWARFLDTTEASVGRWFSGQTTIPVHHVLALCRRYNISAHWVYTGEGAPPTGLNIELLAKCTASVLAVAHDEAWTLTPEDIGDWAARLYEEAQTNPAAAEPEMAKTIIRLASRKGSHGTGQSPDGSRRATGESRSKNSA